MNVNGRVVKMWYWKVARSMRAQGSHRLAMATARKASGRLCRFQACQHVQPIAGVAAREVGRPAVAKLDPRDVADRVDDERDDRDRPQGEQPRQPQETGAR